MVSSIRRLGSIALVLSIGIAGTVHAQFLAPEHSAPPIPLSKGPLPPPRPGPGGGPPGDQSPGADPLPMLAKSPRLQRELGLTPDQIQRLQKMEALFFQERDRLAQAARDPEARRTLERKIRAAGGRIDQVLTQKQLQRLQEILLQQEGPCIAIRDPVFVRKMTLTGRQVQAIRGICHRTLQSLRVAMSPDQTPDCAKALAQRTRLQRLRLQSQVQIESLLSARQRDQLAALEGKPFTLEPRMPPSCRDAPADPGTPERGAIP